MANRHLSRSVVLQTLFQRDFRKLSAEAAVAAMKHNIEEFAPGLEDDHFIEELLNKVFKNQEVIDEILQKAAPEWPIDKISAVDRNILRIGLAELLFGDRAQVPPKVAIN